MNTNAEKIITWSSEFRKFPQNHMKVISKVRKLAWEKINKLISWYEMFSKKFPYWIECITGWDLVENKNFLKVTFDWTEYFVLCWEHSYSVDGEMKFLRIEIFSNKNFVESQSRIIELYPNWAFTGKISKFGNDDSSILIINPNKFIDAFFERISEI
ncbi:MAG: hypothetical protein ACD_4C00321G0003 [uncultured bacterium (gcode 4)]|uniref:Uncharacterized protein n=1 Tax=uncultured bacterium (gcode 4) TaxID=1234023 RepID=K2F5H4_9BACT|nr:MAG: hypothetical protein ACD_4C00321G0003 [uncultured bacterium (gcode 4)]